MPSQSRIVSSWRFGVISALTVALVAAGLAPSGCSSAPGSATDAAAGDGVSSDGPGGDLRSDVAAPIPDGQVSDVGPPTDLPTSPVTWSVAASRSEVEWGNGRLAVHPTQPKTIAVQLEVTSFTPNIEVATSSDLGKTIQRVKVKAYTSSGPGHYDSPLGFGYDPSNGANMALLTLMPAPGTSMDGLIFARSSSGGASFTVSPFSTNPWPPDGMKYAGGPTSALFVRSQHVVYASKDQGQTLSSVFDNSKQCLAHGDFSVSRDLKTLLLVCAKGSLLRCSWSGSGSWTYKACVPAALPGAAVVNRVAFAPHDNQRVVAAAAKQVLVSSDGGKTFAATLSLASGSLHVVRFDPRPASSAVYLYGLASSKLYRSIDGGQHWTNVTPSSSLQPPIGTYLRDVQVAADGTVVGLAHPGVITLPAP